MQMISTSISFFQIGVIKKTKTTYKTIISELK
jgi:hypothetical protein